MSTVQNSQNVWPMQENLDSKYEKCRNITEEIYKRINITFQIKKLETATQSDLSDYSDQIDSNDLSNETDLFACDKSDSLSSSTDAEGATATCEKYININNNEEPKKKVAGTVYKRPRKRFRKRVKKRPDQSNRRDTDGSSDEALPLSRIVDVDTKCSAGDPRTTGGESPDNVMGVPKIVIITKDMKPKIQTPEKKTTKIEPEMAKQKKNETEDQKKAETVNKQDVKEKESQPIDFSLKIAKTEGEKEATLDLSVNKTDEKHVLEWKNCTLCSLSFRGERGLRRHMTMSHIIHDDDVKQPARPEQRDVKPV